MQFRFKKKDSETVFGSDFGSVQISACNTCFMPMKTDISLSLVIFAASLLIVINPFLLFFLFSFMFIPI